MMAKKRGDFTQLKGEILALSRQLDSVLGEERGDELANILRTLEKNIFNVGIIGQIKAGKSTFLNALIEKPGFLPTAVNPWTAVITKLHFGKPGGPVKGGTFRFFSHAEWQELVEYGGLRRRLLNWAKDKIDWGKEKIARTPQRITYETTFQDIEIEREKIRKRATEKLGPHLKHLIGQEHRYKFLDERILKQYLCAGYDPDSPFCKDRNEGLYSDITREAEIYLPMEPFTEYTVFVDTPGTNDPFQLRSNITLDYLAEAQAIVLILAATQALTETDCQLLNRVIRTFHKDRVVVFINQIDRLNDPVGELPRVLERVKNELRSSFPDFDITVLYGSAWWAEAAHAENKKRLRGWLFDEEKFVPWGLHNNCFTQDDIERWSQDAEKYWPEIREAVLRASGIPQTREAIESVLLHERGKAILKDTANALANLAESAADERTAWAAGAERDIETMQQSADEAEKEKAKIEREITELDSKKDQLQMTLRESLDRLPMIVEELSQDLHGAMSRAVSKFATAEATKLREHGISIFDSRYWAADLVVLRDQVSQAFRDQYQEVEREYLQEQGRIEKRARAELEALGFALESTRELVLLEGIDPHPSLTALAKEVWVDLGGWWTRLWSDDEDARERASELKHRLEEAFEPVVRDLVQQTKTRLTEASERFSRSLTLAVSGVLTRLEEAKTQRHQQLEGLLKATDPAYVKNEISKIRARIETLRTEAKVLRDLAGRGRGISAIWGVT